MNITKIGHSCMLVEDHGTRILFDPGNFSTGQEKIKDADAILITHEHPDHIDLENFKQILENNPGAKIFTNHGVGKKLVEHGIAFELLAHGKSVTVKGVTIEGIGERHAVIHDSIPIIENTGYLIAGKLFYPGDAFTVPDKKVEILALPVAGPWMKISEAIEYAKKVKPKVCFPVHDGMLKEDKRASTRWVPNQVLPKEGIEFTEILEGENKEF
ncbi:MBL fold metallo-hydrolase [Candidatus Woesearchaeota archaeon]|nr:MBL fold metallo-hydrolase [Candidatus Woesearchaeota archaeon]